ncbi:MAG TPA: gliding motility-associated C-terminal domain-containing protein [Saprospiraceae bacterium]|nr:gliding motility-associated C-terminal domain-containing protein [Saprospiraceae bacterium]
MVNVKIFLVLLFSGVWMVLSATHNRAGEITYEQIDELTIRLTITTYTKTSSIAADRDSLEVFWGDGTSRFVRRSNGGGDPLPNDVKLNLYITEHTYPGRGTYTVYFTDPNRVGNILNVNPPNSIDIRFFLSTTFTLLDPQFQGFNNSAILLQPPLDFACVGKVFVHNPNAYDPDGDSLAFEFITPFQGLNDPVPNYIYPNNISPGPNNNISLDPVTGTFTWNTPQIQGEYNVAFLVKEYRNGVLINTLIRDMQILVRTCNNQPPTIEAVDEICVIAGELIDLDLLITDAEPMQLVRVEATGGPFLVENPAVFIAPAEYVPHPLEARIVWQTDCNHISDQFYQIVVRAVDNFFGPDAGLATLKVIRIKVLGPPPEDVTGESLGNRIRLEWEFPYTCDEARDEFFQGFSIWRKIGSETLPDDTCRNGLTGTGYEKIVFLTLQSDLNRYFYEDFSVQPRTVYCYRILAEFAKITQAGFPFNRVESIASEEVCVLLKRDIPLITEVSVMDTDLQNGSIRITWTKPLAEDLDTLVNPGPYIYQLQHLQNGVFVNIPNARFMSSHFNAPIDTQFIHNNINTATEQHQYQVAFFTQGSSTPFGLANKSSSVFLTLDPTDQAFRLQWEYDVPWNNYNHTIFRSIGLSGTFEEIGSTNQTSFTDTNLDNGFLYCYYVETEGTYGLGGIPSPLFNFSQIVCDVPGDDVPPCTPVISVSNLCEDVIEIPDPEILGNTIIWFPNPQCDDLDDIATFNIYYSPDGVSFRIIHSAGSFMFNQYFHVPEGGIAGCYTATTVDSVGNESEFGNIFCLENCPAYVLPNTFTPNGDGFNDHFIPRVNRFIDAIDIKVYNQWGNKVFETTDPVINWDGTNFSGQNLSEGVYYYTCITYVRDLNGNLNLLNTLKGHINLLR